MTERVADTEAVWGLLSGELRDFIRRRVRDDTTADDVLQGTFLRIHQGLDQLEDTRRLHAWVYRIARNQIAEHHRRRGREQARDQLFFFEPQPEVQPLEADASREIAAWLASMTDLLPPRYREVVELAEQGLTQAQIAERLGLSLSGAKSRVQRGRARLKALITDCCHLELDRRGKVIDYIPRPSCCTTCGKPRPPADS